MTDPQLRWTPVSDLSPQAREALDRYPEARWLGPLPAGAGVDSAASEAFLSVAGRATRWVGGCMVAALLLWLLPWFIGALVGVATGDWETFLVGVGVPLVFVGLPLFFANRATRGGLRRWLARRLAARRLGQVGLRLSDREHQRGEELVFFLRFTPRRALRVNAVRATVTAGPRTMAAALDRGREIDRGDDMVVAGRFPLPADWPPSGGGGIAGAAGLAAGAARWTLTVDLDVDDWPDYERTVTLVVR